nr:MAG TPA: hypothetical protein [Caudoviricetes sp.]
MPPTKTRVPPSSIAFSFMSLMSCSLDSEVRPRGVPCAA